MAQDKDIKMAVIAGAAEAAKYLRAHHMATIEETIKHVTKNMNSILEKIDKG